MTRIWLLTFSLLNFSINTFVQASVPSAVPDLLQPSESDFVLSRHQSPHRQHRYGVDGANLQLYASFDSQPWPSHGIPKIHTGLRGPLETFNDPDKLIIIPGVEALTIILPGRTNFGYQLGLLAHQLKESTGQDVATYDARGQGASQHFKDACDEDGLHCQERGVKDYPCYACQPTHVDDFGEYVHDMMSVINLYAIALNHSNPHDSLRKVNVYAYSTGALVWLVGLNRFPDLVERIVGDVTLIAPLIKPVVATYQKILMPIVLPIMKYFAPRSPLFFGQHVRDMEREIGNSRVFTDDEAHATAIALCDRYPHLLTGMPSWGWIDAMFRAIQEVQDELTEHHTSLIPHRAIIPADDQIVDASASYDFAILKHIEAFTLLNARHALVGEPEYVRQIVRISQENA